MGIYFFLIGAELCIPFLFAGMENKDKRDRRILFFSVFIIFLLMALKAPTVGRDIPGYQNMYELTRYRDWGDFDLSWMESGYEILMMVFSKIFRAPFQVFMAAIYGFVYLSYYLFLKRYSEDFTTSVLIYICFTFMTFDMSAIRTVLGVAICLNAIPFATEKGLKNTILFVLITLLATQFHKSAYIFFIAFFIIRIPFTLWTSILYIGIPIVVLINKRELLYFIDTYFKQINETSSAMGGNLLVYMLCLLLTGFIWYKCDREEEEREVGAFSTTGLAVRMIYAGILIQLFASNTVLSRMAEYMQIFIIVLIPNNICRLDDKSRIIVKLALYILAIVYFWRFSLLTNTLDIVPYTFFWNTPS